MKINSQKKCLSSTQSINRKLCISIESFKNFSSISSRVSLSSFQSHAHVCLCFCFLETHLHQAWLEKISWRKKKKVKLIIATPPTIQALKVEFEVGTTPAIVYAFSSWKSFSIVFFYSIFQRFAFSWLNDS